MIGFLKNIFSGLFGILGAILRLPITLISLPLKFFSSNKSEDQSKGQSKDALPTKNKKSSGGFYLEADDARGYTAETATNGNAAPKTAEAAPQNAKIQEKAKASQPAAASAKTAVTADALNMPQPTVTTSAAAPEPAYSQFGSRRGPGANMKSFLDMAKTVKRA